MYIRMEKIVKRFNSNIVLDEASFSLAEGEVHALMGENGAGKSTLMKVLVGVHQKESGHIYVDGKEVSFQNPKEAQSQGISFVYQELNSVEDLSVEENIFLGHEIFNRFFFLDRLKMNEISAKLLQSLGLEIDVQTKLENLSVAYKQLVEIARAFLVDSKVIILDEPTAALNDKEVRKLFSVIRLLKKRGVSFVYISHRMDEIFEISDRITVMRDGKQVDTLAVKATSRESLIEMMIGRPLGSLFPVRSILGKEISLRVSNISKKNFFENVSFSLRKGEVLGLYGLMGSGKSEVLRTIFGEYAPDEGEIFLGTRKIDSFSIRDSIKNSVAFVSDDRKEEGLLLDKSIVENLNIVNFSPLLKHGFALDSEKERALTESAVKKFNIKCSSIFDAVETLSGGNQQKVIFARWFFRDAKIFLLDEPTRGVDVGAKQEIYSIMNELLDKGSSIVMVSSDTAEMIGMSDTIMVLREGKVAGVLEKREASEHKLLLLASGENK